MEGKTWTVMTEETSDPESPMTKVVPSRPQPKESDKAWTSTSAPPSEGIIDMTTAEDDAWLRTALVVEKEQSTKGSANAVPLQSVPPATRGGTRKPTLAASQVTPFKGDSLVKRIVQGVQESTALYDPFADCDPQLLANLHHYVSTEEYGGGMRKNAVFYRTLMTAKPDWPEGDRQYGWLTLQHVAAVMLMFRRRHAQSVTPFRSTRIAFVDPEFSAMWVSDFERDYLPCKGKNYKFSDFYCDMYKGDDGMYCTGRKWRDEVDWVYILHNVGNCHWVAIEVDLPHSRIRIFDSYTSATTDGVIGNHCRAFSRMIPHLIRQMLPEPEKASVSGNSFKITRVKGIPQQSEGGDCGIFALKFVECLALGMNFKGLRDEIIPKLRLKYAAEMLDELPQDCPVIMSDQTPAIQKTPFITDSQP